jgi:predicted CoA-binding protein
VKTLPPSVEGFLACKRIAVAGVSRDSRQPANAMFRRFRSSGHEVVPVNPRTSHVEGVTCYPDLGSIPGSVNGLMIATPPEAAIALVRQCIQHGVKHVWFHRSIGTGSVSADAVREAEAAGIRTVIGGCPLMYCGPVDPFHRCMRAWLGWRGRVP